MPADAGGASVAEATVRSLEDTRDELRARIAEMTKTPERGGGISFGKRIGDGTNEAISRITDVAVVDTLQASLERVERALEKIDEGTYGLCDACGKPIAAGRLEAFPDSALCVDCARDPRATR